MQRLIDLIDRKERLVIGQMSGTSLDGVDLALTRLSGSGSEMEIELLDYRSYEMDSGIRKNIQQGFVGNTQAVCRLNYDLGNYFSDQILKFAKDCKLNLADVDLIGLHGQTIYHDHGHSTLQLGEADLVARNTGVVTVADFRAADVAAGGCGAPLVPYLDNLIFAKRSCSIALQNLGGIGNVTFLPKNKEDSIIAFDTGPANMPLNELVKVITDDKEHFDCDSKYSNQGKIQPEILKELLQNNYFSQPLPKSTGHEDFGKQFVISLLNKYPDSSKLDLLRTLVELTVESIFRAYRDYLPDVDLVLLSGGGAKNPLITQGLDERFGTDKVKKIDEGSPVSAEAKEAIAFAVFAHERLNGIPTNVTSVTGADYSVCLGKISIP